MKYCRSCGTEVDENSSYCPDCGEDLESGGGQTFSDEQEEKEGDDRISNNQAVLGFVVFAILVIIVLSVAFGGGGNVESPDTQEPQNTGTTDESTDGSTTSDSSGESSSDDVPTHEMGEAFTVGSGDRAVEYTVEEATTADAIGTTNFNAEADGSFVIVRLTIKNTASEPFPVTTNHLNLVSEQGDRYTTDSDGEVYIGQDSRFDADTIMYEELQPGLSIDRSVVFDVPEGQGYLIEVQSTEFFTTAEPHYVVIGQVG